LSSPLWIIDKVSSSFRKKIVFFLEYQQAFTHNPDY